MVVRVRSSRFQLDNVTGTIMNMERPRRFRRTSAVAAALLLLALLPHAALAVGGDRPRRPHGDDLSDGAAASAQRRAAAAAETGLGDGASVFLHGATLGRLDASSLGAAVRSDGTGGGALRRSRFGSDAAAALVDILRQHRGGSGNERFRLRQRRADVVADDRGHTHVRLAQTYEGLPVVDAAMMMHIDRTGQVYAVNGEFVPEGSVDLEERFTCRQAFRGTLKNPAYGEDAVWLSECAVKVVLDAEGNAHKAWERMIGFTPEIGPYQMTNLYASVVTGEIVAVRPQVLGAMALSTRNCGTSTSVGSCRVVQNGTVTAPLNSTDKAVNLAHNYAIATYNYYKENFGRDSIDGLGMTIVSNVHVGSRYNNAYWSNYYKSVNYGDGDGTVFTFLSYSADVVGHEITHGISMTTSGLTYSGESGALNECMSDVFGACVDRYVGASITDTFLIGEVVYTPNKAGDALRSMTNPAKEGDYDYYPERYTGSSDYGGVHWNSGICNCAFSLTVQGGRHPRNKTNVIVPAIDSDFDKALSAAAKIFYMANTACMTPMSKFHDAYLCTRLYAGNYSESVTAAWKAVGVSFTELTSGVSQTLSASKNVVTRYIYFSLPVGAKLTCTTRGTNGNADLYLAAVVGKTTDAKYLCQSVTSTSNENCSIGPIDRLADITVRINAKSAFTGLKLNCTQS